MSEPVRAGEHRHGCVRCGSPDAATYTLCAACVPLVAADLPDEGSDSNDYCASERGPWYCTAAPGHEPLDHCAYGGADLLCATWPSDEGKGT